MADRPRILAIEDDEEIRYFVAEVLADEGYEVRATDNGREALSLLAEWQPDLILLDLMLPGLDARAFRAAQQAADLGTDIPVVVVSASRQAPNVAAELGAIGVLHKPFDLDELLATVARARAPE